MRRIDPGSFFQPLRPQIMVLLLHQCDSLTDAYMASISNRLNQVMKTLTIVSTIFAPCSAHLHRRHLWHEFCEHA